MSSRIRGLNFRAPAPEYEFADGTVVQCRYLENADWDLYDAYVEDPTDIEKLYALAQAVAPAITKTLVDRCATLQDFSNLIAIGKGHTDVLAMALKNGVSGGELLAPPHTPGSPTMTPSHASPPA